ncbi:hypothetical protein HT576_15855 [Haloterrigena sp. SYSU A121-1]|uniref:Uncharacterized protein n=1 Tax=Haloterrigena gelatinilytica TaxID=2741724 RepID=A0A8J8KGX5_9EURY|nr:hypothetical protein [Haloterrigena gelatinilytica]NUB92487.1 hypothetical protein [Haloterrigena gelatinilytica]
MRFKPVPEPPTDLEAVAPILEAVPETAGAVDDCCGHLVAETRLESRDAAEAWLVFLRALDLVTEESAGYRRATGRSPPTGSLESAGPRLREAFRERVYGADAVLEALEQADGPLAVEDVVDAVRDERRAVARETSNGRRETARLERVRRLLEWAVLLELAERSADGDRFE